MSTAPAVFAGLVAHPEAAGIFCDFDGCLSPIVPEPDAARPVRGASAILERLAKRYASVAVVSGRSVADLARRIHAPGVRLIGLHGMEEFHSGVVTVLPEAEAARGAVERAAEHLERSLRGVRGAMLERKGLALAVHFRRARDPVEAERIASPLVVEAAADAGLAVVPGRRILEVRPMEGGDKGDAVRRVIAEHGLEAALAGGDDVGDLPAFAALDGLPVGIRVAVASAESPAPLVERADVVVGSPKEFVALLRRLA
ncbi:MAG: trehalose-phosphatase [Actinomycetota bacterium]